MNVITPWVNIIGQYGDGSEVTMPVYFVGNYRINGGSTLESPDIIGRRQPTYKSGIQARTHELTCTLWGWGDSVGGYREILLALESDMDAVFGLYFPENRNLVAPLLLERFTWTEQEYGTNDGELTGEPTKAELEITLKTV